MHADSCHCRKCRHFRHRLILASSQFLNSELSRSFAVVTVAPPGILVFLQSIKTNKKVIHVTGAQDGGWGTRWSATQSVTRYESRD